MVVVAWSCTWQQVASYNEFRDITMQLKPLKAFKGTVNWGDTFDEATK